MCQSEAVLEAGVAEKTAKVGSSGEESVRISQLEAKLAKLMNMVQSGQLPSLPAKGSDGTAGKAEDGQGVEQSSPGGIVEIQSVDAGNLHKKLLQSLRGHGGGALSCMEKSAVLSVGSGQVVIGCQNEMVKVSWSVFTRKKLKLPWEIFWEGRSRCISSWLKWFRRLRSLNCAMQQRFLVAAL